MALQTGTAPVGPASFSARSSPAPAGTTSPTTPPTSPPAGKAPSGHRRFTAWRTTPARLRLLAGAAVAAALAMLGAFTLAVADARDGLTLIGHHDGPTVVATSNLYFALADMDAQVANVLLVGDRTDLGSSRSRALQTYDQRRQEVADYLQRTAAIDGEDPVVGGELRGFLVALGRYEAYAAQAILVEGQSHPAPGRPAALALGLYRQATDVMHQQLLPATERLTARSAALVAREYAGARSALAHSLALVIVFGGLLLILLGGLQIFLVRHYRRLVNPAVLVATLAALVLFTTGVSTLVHSRANLRAVKKDAFDSVLALEQARAVSYDANADESRYLLDPPRAGRYESAFAGRSQRLADVGLPSGVAGYDAALNRGLAVYRADGTVVFGGYYGTALRNITFPGEQAAADLTLDRYQVYQLADRTIRRLNTAGAVDEAIRFCTGFGPGDSNALFRDYDQALTAFIGVNTKAFTRMVYKGDNDLSGWNWMAPLVLIGSATLILLGVRPRLAEYRR